MKAYSLNRRLATLETLAPVSCPRCQALENMSDEELDRRLIEEIDFLEGRRDAPDFIIDLPEHSPACLLSQKTAVMSEEDLDAEIARLIDMTKKSLR